MDLFWAIVSSFPFWHLTCLALGLFLAAKCLLQMAHGRSSPHLAVEVLTSLAATGVAIILGLDALAQGDADSLLPASLISLAAFGFGLIFVAAHLGVSLLLARRRQLAKEPGAWLAVALTLAASAWASHRHSAAQLKIEIVKATYFAGAAEIQPVRSWVAVTDRGREVPLFRFELASGTASASDDAVSSPANCHGWVFGSGQYFLECDEVDQILTDNGYVPSRSPQLGDVIVYRNSSGGITHTGIVKAGSLSGSPLIESKWGVRGRFVHRPAEQPYGSHYTFYRSARQGHALAIRPAAQPVLLAGN
jgi:hypothetical protein